MAANTITGQEILFKIAQDCGEIASEFISSVTSQTVLVCRGLGQDEHATFKYGLARVVGKGIRQITAWNHATDTLTLSGAFDSNVAAGEVIQAAWADASRRNLAFAAINEAIRQSWDWWQRDTEVDRGAATITLTSGTHTYSLPSGVGKLLKVGIQPATTDPIYWFDPFEAKWDVYGQEGAFTLAFRPGFAGTGAGYAQWSSRVRLGGSAGSFADAFTGEPLCLKYFGREPELTAETGTTQLPLDYFTLASVLYLQARLKGMTDANEIALARILLPQLMAQAEQAKSRLALTKPRPQQAARLQW